MARKQHTNRERFEPLLREAMQAGPLTSKQIAKAIGFRPSLNEANWGPDAVIRVRDAGLKLVVVGRAGYREGNLYLLADISSS